MRTRSGENCSGGLRPPEENEAGPIVSAVYDRRKSTALTETPLQEDGSHRQPLQCQRSAQVPRALKYSQAYLWLNLKFLSTFAEVVLNRQECQPPL